MTKQDFLKGLEEALNSAGASSLVYENVSYYKGYIEEEEKKGRTEEDITGELGDPHLIARSILDASGNGGSGYSGTETETGTGEDSFFGGSQTDSGNTEKGHGGGPWVWLVPLLVTLLLITIVIMVVVGIFRLLSPILIPILIILVISWIIRGISSR